MPVGEQAAGGSLGTIFYPARPTARVARGQLRYLFPRFFHGRGLSSHRGLRSGRSRNNCGSNLVSPGETFLQGFEAGEIAATCRAAVSSGAEPQQEPGPSRRIIVVLLPFAQFLPVAAGTPRVPPGTVGPHAGFPSVVAAAAAELRNAHETLQVIAQAVRAGDAHIPSPAARTFQLHRSKDPKRYYRPVFGELHRIPRTP